MFKKSLPAFTLLLIVLLCAAMFITTSEGFTTTAYNLDSEIAKTPKLLVLFFTSNCGYCKDLAPEWEKVEAKLPNTTTSVDCTNSSDPEIKAVLKKYSVNSFPTMIYFNNGVVQENYTGPRKMENIVEYMNSKTG